MARAASKSPARKASLGAQIKTHARTARKSLDQIEKLMAKPATGTTANTSRGTARKASAKPATRDRKSTPAKRARKTAAASS